MTSKKFYHLLQSYEKEGLEGLLLNYIYKKMYMNIKKKQEIGLK